jgi:diaminopimelate decarboxylase
MHHFAYRDGVLHAEDVNLQDLPNEVGTPFYCYSTATLSGITKVMHEAFAGTDMLICYAMKANSNQAVIRTMAKLGAGMDVVSEGELRRALAAGFPARKIVFSGVGKTAREMDGALKGIACFNVESEPELELLSARSPRRRPAGPVSIRINPDVDAGPTTRSRPARRKTSSAFPTSGPARSMPGPPSLPGSMWPASTCISAARSPI